MNTKINIWSDKTLKMWSISCTYVRKQAQNLKAHLCTTLTFIQIEFKMADPAWNIKLLNLHFENVLVWGMTASRLHNNKNLQQGNVVGAVMFVHGIIISTVVCKQTSISTRFAVVSTASVQHVTMEKYGVTWRMEINIKLTVQWLKKQMIQFLAKFIRIVKKM